MNATEQVQAIRKASKICSKAARAFEILSYPMMLALMIGFGYLPLIRNDTSRIPTIPEVGIIGKLVNYLLGHDGAKVTLVVVLLLAICMCILNIILMRRLHYIFNNVACGGKIIAKENIKPVKDATVIMIIFLVLGNGIVTGAFFGACLWTVYLVLKYESSIQSE